MSDFSGNMRDTKAAMHLSCIRKFNYSSYLMLLHSLFTKLVIQEIVLVVSGLRTVYY